MKAKDGSSLTSSLRFPLSFMLLLAFIAYSTIINSYFLSDDFVQIGKVLQDDWSLSWGREHGGFFRPLFILSYIIDSRIWGENPLGYHLTNIALHALNSYLVYSLTLPLLRRQSPTEDETRGISLMAGLLFLLHPSHTEAVSWISGRADLLGTLFCLTALLAYIFYVEKPRTLYLLPSLFPFALALLSKESAVSLPFILFASELYFMPVEKRSGAFRQALKKSALFFSILFLFILIRRAALGEWLGGYGAGQHLNFSPGWIRDRFLQACVRAVLPVFPLELSTVLLKPLKSPAFILFALCCIGLVILLLRRRRRLANATERSAQNKLVLLLAGAFIFSLLPVINLRLSPFDTQGERFIYWPSAFSCILVAYLSFILLRSMKWWLILMLCVLVFYSVSLYRTNQTWREAAEVSLKLRDELARSGSPRKSMIVLNAPDNLRGVPVFHNGLEEALSIFQKESRIEQVRALAFHDVQAFDDEVELKREGDVYSLRLLNRAAGFTKIADRLDCLEVLGRSGNALHFRLNNCPDSFALFFFNAGRVYRVIDGGKDSALHRAAR
jgi:cbb3-type cytochrome oxidase subunit 3